MKKIVLIFLLVLPFIGLSQNIKTVVGNGMPGYFGDEGFCLSAELYTPNNVVFDKYGNMYIADDDNNRIRKVNTSGLISTVAGNGVNDYTGDNGPVAELNSPTSITVDSFGNLYIGTGGDSRIRRVNSFGIITTIAGTGVMGYNGDNIAATSAQLSYPYLGAVDPAGNLYFSDDGNYRVRKISTAGIITTIAGNGTRGETGDGGPASVATLNGPAFLNISPSGDIFIPNSYGHCIRKINSAGIITTFAGNSAGGVAGDGIPATDAYLSFPDGVAFDNEGNVYISDYGASVVRKVDNMGIITTIAGTGAAGYSGDGGPATLAEMTPVTLAVDASGNVYIADAYNNRIRRITYNATAVNNATNPSQNITIYPNPACDELTINSSNTITQVSISNIMGQTSPLPIAIGTLPERVSHVDISDLPPGVYVVTIIDDEGNKTVKKVVKE